eukprot:TRINITY_DN257_c0_g1_i2.p1 TRINITY_DN257_c0_g1~~TRINITY_DN257_c0_g1_i2.p1  ORF type:complete len:487 (-),score=183.92 TRINITY_DN257_c0_g1_i2:153-1613(-)
MRAALLFLLTLVVALQAQDANILTGEGLQALYFPGNAGVELSTSSNRSTLAANLPSSFTFEAWVMLPNPPADGLYKTIVSRWELPLDGNPHNRYADFNLQVQASGTLNLFMGNGGPAIYGVLISAANLRQGVWSHVAFSVDTPAGALNPSVVSVFYDLAVWNRSWVNGNRQTYKSNNVMLGDYVNQDRDHKWFQGYMDEVRFWEKARTVDQLDRFRRRVPASDTPNLLAYYRFNDGAGLFLQDSTPRRFDGRLSRVTATTSSPLWRISGAKIHVDVKVASRSISTVFLPGFSTYAKGSLGFNYALDTLPNSDGAAGVGRLLADGLFITNTPFVLRDNTVTYEAPNATGVVIQFSYFGTTNIMDPNAREAASTIVYLQVGDLACVPDMCGRCGGDNSTCTCLPLPYNGYNLNDIERILLLYEIEQTLDLLSQLETKLTVSMATLATSQAGALTSVVNEIQNFNTNCLTTFCEKVDKYFDALTAISPQ